MSEEAVVDLDELERVIGDALEVVRGLREQAKALETMLDGILTDLEEGA